MDEKIARTCPARNTCKQHNKLCSTGCPWFIDLRYQMELSGIPKRHQKYNADTMPDGTIKMNAINKFNATIIDRVDQGQGLFLFGNTGSGKTTTICSLAISYILKKTLDDIRNGKRTKQLVQYVNVPDMLDLLKRGFDDPEVAQEGVRVLENLRKVPFAIIDDIGAERPSEWARERLLTLVGGRYDDELSTFFTSNLTLPELGEPLGPRIQSRISGMSIPLEYKGIDRRKML